MKRIPLLWIAFLLVLRVGAQCTTNGQTPQTAFPVCGVDTFSQQNVPTCVNQVVKTFCNDGVIYQDINPFWYRFTCFQTGTLGFSVVPNNLNDDYDWILYDITNRNVADVYDSTNFIVTYNWSGNSSLESARGYTGITGTSTTGTQSFACATNPQELGGSPPYSDASTINKMPVIYQGHTYLLMVSHFTQTQSGYNLSFGGGTASITDTTQPKLSSAFISCDARTITLVLNKRMKCSSLAPDGTDFILPSVPGAVLSASAINCSNGFDMDSVQINLKNPLPPGNYSLQAEVGTDGNTVLDNCNAPLAVGASVPFTVTPEQPTPMDSISPLGCSPGVLRLVFKKPILCSSIAADGSDFFVTGPTPVSITGAAGNCVNGMTSDILITLSAPIVVGGIYQISLRTGTDGNTIVDECGQVTPAPSSLNFAASDTVSAQFSYTIQYGCKADTVYYAYSPAGGVNQWQWTFDNQSGSPNLGPVMIYTVFGQKTVQHVVTNGVCSDTMTVSFALDNTLKAAFQAPDVVCPKDLLVFADSSIGNIMNWDWNFGDGTSSSDENPRPHLFPNTLTEKTYTVSLIVTNNLMCTDTAQKTITKLQSCYITVPNAFTPNGDGKNDYLYPLNAYKATDLLFRVYNRYGQLVFETRDWTRKWDGTINGIPQDTGVYVWMLQYTDQESGKKFFLKGTSVLIR